MPKQLLRFFFLLMLLQLKAGLNAQDSVVPQQPFVVLKDKTLLLGNTSQLDERVFKASTITLDGRIIKTKDVIFYQDNAGTLYGRFNGLIPAIRARNNFNFFSYTTTTYQPGSRGQGGYYSSKTHRRYCVGIGEMKSISLANMRKDIQNDPEAELFLAKATKQRKIAGICFVATVVALAGTAIPNTVVGYSMGVISLGGLVTGIVFSLKQKKTLVKAVYTHTGYSY